MRALRLLPLWRMLYKARTLGVQGCLRHQHSAKEVIKNLQHKRLHAHTVMIFYNMDTTMSTSAPQLHTSTHKYAHELSTSAP